MKVKFKLLVFILLLAVVPIIIVNVYSSVRMNRNSMELISAATAGIVANQADNVNFYFEEAVASAKNLALSENVRNYTRESNEEDFDIPEESDKYKEITGGFSAIEANDAALQKIMIINNSGMIIASTDSSDTGKRMSNYKGLFTLAQNNNGVSSFFMSGDESDIPVFIVAKSVYSYDNVCQGIVYQLYNTNRLQEIINSAKLDKYTTAALMDTSGNLLEYPYKTLRSYTESDNYKPASNLLLKAINPTENDPSDFSSEFGSDRGARILFVSAVPSCHWTMLAVADKVSLQRVADRSGQSIRNVSIIVLIVACILTFAFIYWFSKPINEIMRILQKKKKGDMYARFDIKSSDEFSQIGNAFNTLFDDVFESEQRYKTIVEITNNIIFEISFKKGTVFVSKNFNKKFSYRPKDDSMKESFFYKIHVHKDDKERYMNDLERILGPANFMQGEYRVKSIYGDFIWIMIKATKFYNRDEVPTKIVGVIMDIDKEKKSEMHLIQRASNDALTQLFNREAFIKSLTAAIEESAAKKSLDAMMFIDLDDFKFFNDQYGHACGDEVLKFVADTLKEISFERGFAGRFGGDEFVVCLTNLTLYGDSGKIAQEIIDILGSGFTSESTGLKLNVHCSVGIAFLRESGKNAEEVIAAADEAMYNIKKHGKSAYAYAKSPQKQPEPPSAKSDGGYVNELSGLI
ncbi:MAG: diguanylate cyclase [Oscillospiraceae bacterium]|nr:diguanylate cyclase [Oscillospiraceae bacterium]